jgi:protein-L-isoaspartate(D-aspartate) O-methyltransferase
VVRVTAYGEIPEMDFVAARRNMIESQLRTNRIVDEALLAVMADVPRERFVPEHLQGIAYVDEDLAIGGGRYIMEPLVLAAMIQGAGVRPADVVLDIASGTGYAAAVLARLAGTVFALESDAALAARAGELYLEMAPDNVVPIEGPLAEGCAEHAPFDVILIEGTVERVPDAILDQLGDDGRLVAVVLENGIGRMTVIRKSGGHYSQRAIRDANTPQLEAFQRPPEFVF